MVSNANIRTSAPLVPTLKQCIAQRTSTIKKPKLSKFFELVDDGIPTRASVLFEMLVEELHSQYM